MRTLLSFACLLIALVLPAGASAVVGGKAVQTGSYPFVVSVGDAAGPKCGGTLIAADVVLTAAHCIVGVVGSPDQLRILSGSTRISSDLAAEDAAGHVARVTAFYVHPKFNRQSMRYDAALLILEQPLSGVRTLGLASASPIAGSTVTAAGWGATQEDDAAADAHLRSVSLKVGTAQSCARANAALDYFAPSMLCASSPGRDTCSGDSGGPLVATSGGQLALVGITSFGRGCARTGHPGVYTRASAIRGWVTAQVARAALASARLAQLQSAPAA